MRETLDLPVIGGRFVRVAGRRVGRLFVHRTVEPGVAVASVWSITHAESGVMLACDFGDEASALAAAAEVDALADWNRVLRAAAHGTRPPEALGREVSRIVATRGGTLGPDGGGDEATVYLRRRYRGDA